MTRVLARVATWLALALATGLVAHATSADATPPPAFVAVGHSPTQGTPVPGAYLTADLGAWTSPPESYGSSGSATALRSPAPRRRTTSCRSPTSATRSRPR